MKWYQRTVWIVVLLLFCFPVGIILMWLFGKRSAKTKLIITAITLAIGIPLWASAVNGSGTSSEGLETTLHTIASSVTESTAHQTTTIPETTLVTTETTTTETTETAETATQSMQTVSGGVLRVHYLDVGQADSEFIQLPDGKCMLIDAGNRADGSMVVGYIKNLGYSKIDYLVGTHPHEDHIGGMPDVIDSFDIGAIYMPKVSTNTQTFDDLLTLIQDKGYTINTAKAGAQIAPGINILSPSADYGSELNDWSAVISLTYGSKTFLFLGDAGTGPESTFSIDADVVKVAHHGSRTAYSASLYQEWTPSIAIISVGSGNSYGLPDEEVIDGLKAVGATLYRTDENGTIIIECDGSNLNVAAKASAAPTKAPTSAPAATTKTTSTATTAPAPTTAAPVSGSDQLYRTETGECYHRDGCSSLSKSKIPITLEEAKAAGLRPCSRCDPPQ